MENSRARAGMHFALVGLMSSISPSRSAKAIKIYCPLDCEALELVAAGQFSSVGDDTAFSAIMSIIQGDNPLGDFGIYKSVVELSSGWELFVPGSTAKPALGRANTVTASPTVILTVYVPGDASVDAISDALAAIMAAHPWETPVVEVSETTLLIRS